MFVIRTGPLLVSDRQIAWRIIGRGESEVAVEKDSEWWVRVLHAFTTHVRDERYVLARYEELAASTSDPGTQFLLNMIVTDEHRHHELFERMEESASVHPTRRAEQIPPVPHPEPELVPALLEQTKKFLEVEREDASGLKALSREVRSTSDDMLWHLVIELMRLDTEKHMRILDYLKKRLEHLDG